MITLERVSAVGRFDMGRSLFVVPQQPRAEAVTRKKSKLLLGPQKEKPALVQVDDVSDVEVVPGRLVHLIADESIRRFFWASERDGFMRRDTFCTPSFSNHLLTVDELYSSPISFS